MRMEETQDYANIARGGKVIFSNYLRKLVERKFVPDVIKDVVTVVVLCVQISVPSTFPPFPFSVAHSSSFWPTDRKVSREWRRKTGAADKVLITPHANTCSFSCHCIYITYTNTTTRPVGVFLWKRTAASFLQKCSTPKFIHKL